MKNSEKSNPTTRQRPPLGPPAPSSPLKIFRFLFDLSSIFSGASMRTIFICFFPDFVRIHGLKIEIKSMKNRNIEPNPRAKGRLWGPPPRVPLCFFFDVCSTFLEFFWRFDDFDFFDFYLIFSDFPLAF